MIRFLNYILLFIFLTIAYSGNGQQGQIAFARITAMPDQPVPFNIRDWKNVAIKYDSFIYDANKQGQYLPLVSYNSNAINYTSQKQIRLHTYVGTFSPNNSEGINVLPSLVGAALCGQDIRSIYGKDRLVMAQDFFNKKNGENLYLNNASAGSGGDWWYDVMPNIYFYQLYDIYPHFNSEASYQFSSIADKFLEATRKMGGMATPWTPAFMNYRAWNFKTMEPNANGVKEPETAGTFAWLLYHAYKNNQNEDYLKGAEWSMEYLNSLNSNPSYELQMPYGAYTASKMNAEIGTQYDVEKMVGWCFNKGPLRGWGTIVGKWGSFDVSGLVGEANDQGNDYAFVMNGMQQAAALVPMVRYDKRFAKAIGKWMLNLSNASRLFYPGFLPASLQDGAAWSQVNDPNALIAHEAMKQKVQNLSPYATGDALGGGWAATNLAVYGSSSVGYLGAIVSKTNIDKILQLNLNATDFYADVSYPSYLYFNPFDTPKTISLNVGNSNQDIYESLSEKFILKGVTGIINIIIPPKEAILVVIAPLDGVIAYDRNKMLIDNVVVDFNQHMQSFTYSPRIKALEAEDYIIEKNGSTTIYCTAHDKDSGQLVYNWYSDNGLISGEGSEVILNAPSSTGKTNVTVIVSDAEGNADSLTITIDIVDVINKAPVIHELTSDVRHIGTNEILVFTSVASDANGDNLTYEWSADGGSVNDNGSGMLWVAPSVEGIYHISVTVDDGKGLTAHATRAVLVKNFDGEGQIIAWYPFTGNANDRSGNEHHGISKGAVLTSDFQGGPNSAYYFNGGAQHIEVASSTKLNTLASISVSLWSKPNLAADKEIFLMSHGSWQNRWKLSLTPTKKLRWTINTLSKTADLDTDFELKSDSVYHIVATYDGETMLIFVNGQLNVFTQQSGAIRTTNLPLLIGQMLPSDANYNYKGILDEVKIFDYPLQPYEVSQLYDQGISKVSETEFVKLHIYPNPTFQKLIIAGPDTRDIVESISIIDALGRQMIVNPCTGTCDIIDVSHLESGIYFLLIKSKASDILNGIQFIKL
ncbi:MAG: T9SS type A sorting domain-containing protein [Saprospiraceae bacterium]|nr:T9SS type A sorting domain-containing protein [Saprospiraceae bacterium]